MSLDLPRVAASLGRSAPADANAITDALAAFVEDVLALHAVASGDASLPSGRVVTHFAPEVTGRTDERARADLMGAPARYAEVVLASIGEEPLTSRALPGVYRFRVYLYWGVTDRASGARGFRALLAGTDPTRPGILPALALQSVLSADGRTVHVDAASLARTAFLNPNPSDQRRTAGWRHEAQLDITLTT